MFRKKYSGHSPFILKKCPGLRGLNEHWISSEKLELFTDASNLGFAGVLKGKWFQGSWPCSWEQKHITIKELFPIVLALKM